MPLSTTGDGTIGNKYKISTPAHWDEVIGLDSNLETKYFIFMEDVDYLAGSTGDLQFYGDIDFNGNGFIISVDSQSEGCIINYTVRYMGVR